MRHTFVQVDAFTHCAFAGNPAAVFITDAPRDEKWMQSVAQEMNLSETAFLHPVTRGFSLRWFTPTMEVDLCGHATLASAHALWEQKYLSEDAEARFETRSGMLRAKRKGGWTWLDFPATPATPVEPPSMLADALGAVPLYVGRTNFDYLVELGSPSDVTGLLPDLENLKRLPARGIIVTARSAEFDFISRYFAPASGIPEDPVTGSAHCALGPYWQAKTGRSDFTAHQASRRGGLVRIELSGERVHLGGQAVTTVRGDFLA